MTIIVLLIFTLCLLVQVYFFVQFSIVLRSDNLENDKGSNSVSVIIAARNEANNLAELLEQLTKQDHSSFEVILVNDRSIDSTRDIAKEYTSKYANFHLVDILELPGSWTGKKHALYRGVEQAKNDILLFTDADCLPTSERWITEMTKPFISTVDIVLGLSPYQKRSGCLNQFVQFETLFVAMQFSSFTRLGRPYMGLGRNMAIRANKYDLRLLRNFSSLEGGDDDLMVNNIATKENTVVITHKDSQTISIPKNVWRDYFRQKIRHLSVGKHYHKKDRTLLAFFTLSFLFGWLLFLSLLVSAINPYFILTAFALRSLSFYVIFARIGQKLESPINFWAIPLLDLCYSIYYPIIGLKALLTKNIQWK